MRPTARSTTALALLLSAVAAAAVSVDAQSCDSLKQNTLTSVGCPATCLASAPCVVYAPSLNASKPCMELGSAVGKCQQQTAFSPPSAPTESCTVTYQCMEGIVTSGGQWLLALDNIKGASAVSMALVTEINSLVYNPTSTVSVQLAGGPTLSTRKGDMKEVVLDQSFFNTPTRATTMFLLHLNLRNALTTYKLNTNLKTLSLVNVNLDQVPAQLTSLTALTKLDMTKNYLKSFSGSADGVFASMKNLTNLNLAENDLTALPSALPPAIDTLNLTGNPLASIPDVIFKTPTLRNVYMRDCNLTNVQLTEEQFVILNQLTVFDATVTVTECASGFEPRDLQKTKVCSATGKKESGGSNTVVIIVCVVGGVVVVGLLAFIVARRRRQPPIIDPTDKPTYTLYGDGTTGTLGDGSDTFASAIWNDPELQAARVDHRDVEPIKLLARGGFGEVWLGLYMGENVAIKRLLSDKKSMNDALQFASEIRLMARLEHPKIVRFIGVSWASPLTIQAVTEFMDCGDLKSLLDSNRSSSLTWANLKCQIAIDIADALVYLHTLSPKLIHRDLKSRNVLIDAQTGAKLSDFGISRDRSVEETMTAGVGTARWIAPEVVLGGHYTEAADIYSYGVVLSELDTCKAPFHDATNTNGAKMQDVTILQLVSAGKLQPSFSESCPPSILRLARSCLEFDASRRPTSMQIMYELRNILKNELK